MLLTTGAGQPGYRFFSGGRPLLVVDLDHLCEVINLYSAQGNLSYHVVFMVRHSRDSYIVLALLSLEWLHRKLNQLIEAVIHTQVRLTSGS